MGRQSKIIFALWAVCLFAAMSVITYYSTRPGATGKDAKSWPTLSQIRSHQLPSLLIFLHSQCSCSRATLGELERLMPAIKDKFSVTVLFADLAIRDHRLEDSALWEQAHQILGINEIRLDRGNSEAHLFGALTSGQVYLYSEQGDLIFSGGITPSRSHMGDSDGRRAILAWLEHHEANFTKTSPFGCSLQKTASYNSLANQEGLAQ